MDSIVDSAPRSVAETGDGQGDGSKELAEVRELASKLTPDRLEAFLDELGAELDSYLVDQIKNLVDQLPPRKLAALYELLRKRVSALPENPGRNR